MDNPLLSQVAIPEKGTVIKANPMIVPQRRPHPASSAVIYPTTQQLAKSQTLLQPKLPQVPTTLRSHLTAIKAANIYAHNQKGTLNDMTFPVLLEIDYTVLLVDEYRTSGKCSVSQDPNAECKPFRMINNPRLYRNGRIRCHGLLRCATCKRLCVHQRGQEHLEDAKVAIDGNDCPPYLRRGSQGERSRDA